MKAERKKRVLVVGPYPPPYAGPEISIQNTLNSPLSERFHTKLLKTNVHKSNANKGTKSLSAVIQLFFFFVRLFWRLITFRPHVVYYFVTATRLGWLGRDIWCILLSRIAFCKIVIHMRAGHFQNNLRGISKWNRALIRFACHRTTSNLVQANNLKGQFQGLAPEARISVMPNMIDDTQYSNGDLENFDENRILFMGHLSHAKGYCDLLKAIPMVATEFPDVVFQFAGTKLSAENNVFHCQLTGKAIVFEDPDHVYEQTIKGKYEKNYEYLGIIKDEKKLQCLTDCNLFVLPSYSEGFSMAVLEALAMGKPVVCTPVGGMRDVMEDNVTGLLVNPGDSRAMAAAILELLKDRQKRDRIAENNVVYVQRHYSMTSVGNRLADHFATL